jgi:hypothetical protein
MQVIKRARHVVSDERKKCLKRMPSESSSDDDILDDPRHRKRRMREKVAEEVARVLDQFSGETDIRGELMQARVIEAAEESINALENEILPELHKIEAKVNRGELPGAQQEQYIMTLSRKCEEYENELQKTKEDLRDETAKRKEALKLAYHENQERIQEKHEKDRYTGLWQDAEKRAIAAEVRLVWFSRPETISCTSSYVH